MAEIIWFARRDVVEHLRLEHVDAGVDGVGEDLAPTRLLEEAFDASLFVHDDHAELQRVLDALQGDGHQGLALCGGNR